MMKMIRKQTNIKFDLGLMTNQDDVQR